MKATSVTFIGNVIDHILLLYMVFDHTAEYRKGR